MLSLLAESNVVSSLSLTNTGIFVEQAFVSLSSAVCQHLTQLKLGNNKFTAKYGDGRDSAPSPTLMPHIYPTHSIAFPGFSPLFSASLPRLFPNTRKTLTITAQMTQFLLTTPSLLELDLSGTKLPGVAFRSILDSLATNPLLSNVTLRLASCDLGLVEEDSKILQLALPRLSCISRLDIASNGE